MGCPGGNLPHASGLVETESLKRALDSPAEVPISISNNESLGPRILRQPQSCCHALLLATKRNLGIIILFQDPPVGRKRHRCIRATHCTRRTLKHSWTTVPQHRTRALSLIVDQGWGVSARLKEYWAIWPDDIASRCDLASVQRVAIGSATVHALCAMIRSLPRQYRPPDEDGSRGCHIEPILTRPKGGY
jgi:hypothetical protein